MGLSTSLRYKQLTLGMRFRANIDNYVYNGMGMSTGAFETVSYNNSQLNNLNISFLKTGFKTRQYLSDLLCRECFLPKTRQPEFELQCRQNQQVGFAYRICNGTRMYSPLPVTQVQILRCQTEWTTSFLIHVLALTQ